MGFGSFLALLSLVLLVGALPVRGEDFQIRLNTVGFLPGESKVATVAAACGHFSLVRVADGKVAFEGTATGPKHNADTGEELYQADFSACKEPGRFEVRVDGVGKSPVFSINRTVYNDPYRTVMQAMYLWRCGAEVSMTNGGNVYRHDACHTNDAWLDYVTGEHARKASIGGWHDAGDYNKYVVNAGVSLGVLFRAWADFGWHIRRIPLGIPPTEGEKIPEFLGELKWELDWLLTMQAADGSVYHKVSTTKFGGFVMPENEKEERYFAPWSSAATADFAAVMAIAGREFKPYDPVYATRCLEAARKSMQFLKEHPENHPADLKGFSTGTYQVRDADARLWAAAEMWETTGEANYLHEFEEQARTKNAGFDALWDYGNLKNLGLLTYLFSKREGRDQQLLEKMKENLLKTADGIVEKRDADGYARPAGSFYIWGCNGHVARETVILQAAYKMWPHPKYRDAALDAIGYLLGRNCYGRSFVTGVGANPPMHPHDRRSSADHIEAPWPGYLVGGPNPHATDWHDEEKDFRTNEIAINWNAALVYALAGFLAL